MLKELSDQKILNLVNVTTIKVSAISAPQQFKVIDSGRPQIIARINLIEEKKINLLLRSGDYNFCFIKKEDNIIRIDILGKRGRKLKYKINEENYFIIGNDRRRDPELYCFIGGENLRQELFHQGEKVKKDVSRLEFEVLIKDYFMYIIQLGVNPLELIDMNEIKT